MTFALKIQTAEQIAAADAEAKRDEAKREAREYLAATDWYVTRRAETKKKIPAEITAARAAARELLSE